MNKSIPLIICFIAISCFMSCTDSSDCCTIIDVGVTIHYKTDLGVNLINSSEAFSEANIKIYYKDGEDFKYAYNSNLTHPNMHQVYEHEDGRLILSVFPSNYYDNDMSTTLIQLNESVVDTLVCEFELGSNKEICTGAWLNGVEMIDRFISIKK